MQTRTNGNLFGEYSAKQFLSIPFKIKKLKLTESPFQETFLEEAFFPMILKSKILTKVIV